MVGIMLTTYNQLEDTKRSLQSLRENTTIPYKLVIVDNASTDGTVDFLRDQGYQIIENQHPVCLSVALNQGLRHLLADPDNRYIGWVHNDMLFYPKWMERILDLFAQETAFGKIAPVSLHLFGPDDPKFAEEFMLKHHAVCYPGNACPWVMPREVVEKVGYFDERFIQCGGYEDWDYNNRILEEGYQVVITMGSTVWHPAMGTRKNHDESASALHNAAVYHEKWGIDHPKV
ncbi:glycosyltransferase family 2 protein [Effusibacillus lacus]|uniref:Glycosyltransferase 2-like domain-containing protein n=1 Tax=Effusibacillus lacus TaxID=1348429 RepID=A0A292YT92_9BACL|nr:glycosyltransferase [Effusibacillus lacus]TCS73521.1 GT2 family glycosyltransferase [Effusibacillus lacus]GAX91983.1 hypothetical protein EFBL_3674 [Effusibacillus lacus]